MRKRPKLGLKQSDVQGSPGWYRPYVAIAAKINHLRVMNHNEYQAPSGPSLSNHLHTESALKNQGGERNNIDRTMVIGNIHDDL